jgi:hypothetical protein
MNFNIRMEGDKEAVKWLEGMAKNVTPAVENSLRETATKVEMVMKANAPFETGSLMDSIETNFEHKGETSRAVIGPVDSRFGGRYAGAAIEGGRRPGRMPPYQKIASRYGIPLSYAYNIAKKIKEKGTAGTFFVKQTFGMVQGEIEEMGYKILYYIAGR